jgi:chromate transporter
MDYDKKVSRALESEGRLLEIAVAFGRLGLTSFGGPIAHLGYLRREFVENRKWLDERAYADLVALCQLLPGPASSQCVFALGLLRAGIIGGLIASFFFTAPSALLMILFGIGIHQISDLNHQGWLRGLQLAAVAVVAQAVLGMSRALCPDRERASFAFAGAILLLLLPGPGTQILVLILGGLAGLLLLQSSTSPEYPVQAGPDQRSLGAFYFVVWLLLLFGLPAVVTLTRSHWLETFYAFFRSGSLVFGGGHVVLPLLQSAVVDPGWISQSDFLSGYGAAQALPGPLFTFAGYLGAAGEPGGWIGGIWTLIAIFLPGWLLVLATLPFWHQLRSHGRLRRAMDGANAAVVGILGSTLYSPIFIGTVHTTIQFALVLLLFALLVVWKLPSWVIALAAAGLGQWLLGQS